MTNAYPFLPITPKSLLIVLFDNNGPDLNLLDPFHFEFHRCALKAEHHAGLHNAALSCKFGAFAAQVCMAKGQSNEHLLPGDGSVALCGNLRTGLARTTKSM